MPQIQRAFWAGIVGAGGLLASEVPLGAAYVPPPSSGSGAWYLLTVTPIVW